jgi:hypothetical protein
MRFRESHHHQVIEFEEAFRDPFRAVGIGLVIEGGSTERFAGRCGMWMLTYCSGVIRLRSPKDPSLLLAASVDVFDTRTFILGRRHDNVVTCHNV